jgi:hypothetical protein
MSYKDSVGNVYRSVPPAKINPGPKPTHGGGDRKIGNKKKKPSAKRYLSERRWETNKARRARRRERNRPRKGA